MIFDKISNLNKYKGINKNLDQVIDFIATNDLAAFPDGEHKIDDDNFFKKIDQACFNLEDAPYELHKIYADIHIIVDNKSEFVGFRPKDELEHSELINDDPEHDVRFVKDEIKNTVHLENDKFVLFMPGEGHAPKIKNGFQNVNKIIFKVKW
jgi:biofilm protein TabA